MWELVRTGVLRSWTVWSYSDSYLLISVPMSHSEPPWDQYARQMFTLKIGWAVWDGHPANADEEIRVGSVVYPLDGRLTPLFNVLEEENVQGSSSQDVPDPFQPLNVANLNIRDHDLINHSPLSTDSIAWEKIGRAHV